MLKDSCYERNFGLKVALNTVDPSKLKSIDSFNFEEQTVQTRKQTSKSSSMDAFGIDIIFDFMRTVTGEPEDPNLATQISGMDALSFSSKIRITELDEKIKGFLEAYNSDRYKEHFSWVDNLIEIRDPIILDELHAILLEALTNRNFENMHLAPPEPVEWGDIEGFSFSIRSKREDLFPDLSIEDYYNCVKGELTLAKLKGHKVLVEYTNGTLIPKWRVYESIVFETYLGEELYVFTMGKWFNIESDFSKKVDEYVKNIIDVELDLPICYANETETQYNKRAARTLKNIVLLDSKLINCDSSRGTIEICDLFTEKGQFIHVKVRDKSSTLSHLFAQGRVSAESFLDNPAFREAARKLKGMEKISHLFPPEKPNPREYEIVFAFIDSSDKSLNKSLPFFTKLNFMQTTRTLSLWGFKVSKYKIQKENDAHTCS